MEQHQSLQEQFERHRAEYTAGVLANYPFDRVVVQGQAALAAWQRLQQERDGIPVIVGCDEDAVTLLGRFDFSQERVVASRSPSEILAAANSLAHPEDLKRQNRERYERERRDLTTVLDEDAESGRSLRDWMRSQAPAGASDGEALALPAAPTHLAARSLTMRLRSLFQILAILSHRCASEDFLCVGSCHI
jgi:hypothetical protein